MTDPEIVRLARALADPTRLRVLRTIAAGSRVCCGDIAQDVSVRPATISHHLRVLGEAGLIESRRDGQFIHVCLNQGRLLELREALATLLAPGVATTAPGTEAGTHDRPRRPRSRRVA